MIEINTSKTEYSLSIDGKYHNTLDIEGFSHMMKDPSYCYKFYWLEAIVQLISEGVAETTFEGCYRDNLHSIWAGQEIYRKGNSREEFYNILQKNMQPVYDSAKRQGYEVWNRW